MSKKSASAFFFLFVFSIGGYSFAASTDAPTSAGIRTLQQEDNEKKLRQDIEKKAIPPEIKEELPAQPAAPESTGKTLINTINVTGATRLPAKEVQDIILPFQGKELTMGEMEKAAGLITDSYRQKGYITSRAYLPPQKIEGGVLEIRVVEGLMGELNVSGNRYFKTSLLKREVALKKGELFNYNYLRQRLSRINQYPDRNVRAVLLPGKEAGTTDVNLEVKDNLPIHLALDWDNFGSRFIHKDRYETILKHDNLLGFDDILTLQYQLAQADTYELLSLRYLFPVNNKTDLGFFMAQTKLQLGREFEALNARGKGRFYSLYGSHGLINTENVSLSLRLGFDYKDIFNFQQNNETSRDRMRVLKTSFNLDVSDGFGRTILDNELSCGIPDMMGGSAAKDPGASVTGSGGKFVKNTISLLRLQKMPFASSLLWKNQIQVSPYTLTATEEYQLGGIANLRGYPPAEVVGDNGYTTTLEWSFPPYFIPKSVKVPFSKAKVTDALRWVLFYDWGNVKTHRPDAGEEKTQTLSDIGCGIRFNLPENFNVRIDIAWPLGKSPSDEDHVHPWFQVSKEF